ncbi:MAG TPA: hypothetical protein VF771_21225, partial [Longimicrobiaceae bacterium]
MHVLHTIASTRRDHGGTSRSIPRLCEALSDAGVQVTLHTSRPPASAGAAAEPILPSGGVRTVLLDGGEGVTAVAGRGRRLRASMAAAAERAGAEIVHDHGAWLASNR